MKTFPKIFILNENPLPWVTEFKYLGLQMSDCLEGQKADILAKHAAYIDKEADFNKLFHSSHPEVKCRINKIYNVSFYGSPL